MLLAVRLLVGAFQHDRMIGREVVGVVRHIGLMVASVKRRVPGVQCDRADDGVVEPKLLKQHGAVLKFVRQLRVGYLARALAHIRRWFTDVVQSQYRTRMFRSIRLPQSASARLARSRPLRVGEGSRILFGVSPHPARCRTTRRRMKQRRDPAGLAYILPLPLPPPPVRPPPGIDPPCMSFILPEPPGAVIPPEPPPLYA
jgi:hypothetical protein